MDEFGVFQGIITLNDILRSHSWVMPQILTMTEYRLIANDDNSWTIDGQYSLHDFLTYFDLDELTSDLRSDDRQRIHHH